MHGFTEKDTAFIQILYLMTGYALPIALIWGGGGAIANLDDTKRYMIKSDIQFRVEEIYA